MTAPGLAAARFAMALGVGAVLGLVYGFLRPLRPKLTHLVDALFVMLTFVGWVYLGFGLCGGDLRFGYTMGMILGGFAWELTVGRLLRPVWRLFWNTVRKILAAIFFPIRKIWDFFIKNCKKVLAFLKKWVTIGWSSCRSKRHRSGGVAHGKAKEKGRSRGAAQEQSPGEGSDPGGRRIVYGSAGGPARQY